MSEWRRWLLVWGPLGIGLTIVATTSGGAYSQAHIEDWVAGLLQSWLPGLASGGTVLGITDVLLWALRKPAHLVEYGLLALLAQRALDLTMRWPRWRIALSAILFCSIVGSLDELHQSLLQERTALAGDVLADVAGAMLALGVYYIFIRRANRGGKRRGSGEL